MHLALASAQHHPSHGGIGCYVWELVHAANDAGWRVDLITRPSSHASHLPVDGLHVISTEDRKPEFAHRVAALRRIERIRPYRYGTWSLAVAKKFMELDIQPDEIEFVDCQAEGFVSLSSGQVRRRFRHARFIVSAHTPMWLNEQHAGVDALRFGRDIYHQWERQAVAAADAVIAPSTLLLHRLGDLSRSTVQPLPMRATQPCAPAGGQLIVLVGAVQPQKGVHVWARSLNQVLMTKPRATAMLIGPDTPTAPDGLSMAAHVQRLIDPRCIDRFRWMGALPHEHVMRLMDDAAAVVVPSVFESFSYAAAEAIMRGRPVIITDQVGVGEHVPGLSTVSYNDADALAEAQIEVLNDLPGAHQRALKLRQALMEACDPQSYIACRSRFIESVAPRGESDTMRSESDATDEMAAFLREIDEVVESASTQPSPAEPQTLSPI